MATIWTQERASTENTRLRAASAEDHPAETPMLLDQNTRFLLSPVPAVAAVQGPNKSTPASIGLCSSSSTSSPSLTSARTVTLYPVEAVPSHLLCAICTLPYENPVHFLPCCHVFCLECIQLWIGMNLSDDLLQNELRRAYPAEGDIVSSDTMSSMAGYSDISQPQSFQQQFMSELARMGDSQFRPGTSAFNNFYDSFNHLTLAQQQLLQQQQTQQRIAVLLESRDMPKCPMCRTGLHINGWDRVEEQIKVPVSVSPRPSSSDVPTSVPLSPSSGWHQRRGLTHHQRPVSGVERRRARSDRLMRNGVSRRREEVIGEEEEELEEVEMEHVGELRDRRQNSSNGGSANHLPSRSNYGRPDRIQRLDMNQSVAGAEHEASRYANRDRNDDDEVQSPTAAVIGRRPSEWMRYQQQQANRLRVAASASATSAITGNHSEQGSILFPHAIVEDRYNDQQEQIRRLYLEQESQEELLRSLTARAASIIEEQEEFRRRESDSSLSTTGADASIQPHSSPQLQSHQISAQSALSSQEFSSAEESAAGVVQPQPRHSLLQIGTSSSQPSSRQSQDNQSTLAQPQQIGQGSSVSEQGPAQLQNAQGTRAEPSQVNHLESLSNGTEEVSDDSGDNNSVIEAIQQGTRAWTQRPSSLRLDLDGGQGSLTSSLHGENRGNTSISDSISNSTSSSDSHSPNVSLSPSNESSVSYRTSSTFSQSIQNHPSTGTPFSQRSSTQAPWERHSLSLQMPVLDTRGSSFGDAEDRQLSGSLAENESGRCMEQPWMDYIAEEQEGHSDCQKMAILGSTSEGRVDTEDDNQASSSFVVPTESGEDPRQSKSSVTSTALPSDNNQGSSSEAILDPNVYSSLSFGLKMGSSMTPPLIRDLDIHTPIVTAEGTVTTIANMQIDADILARARSDSILLSEEDVSSVTERPSPVDSPIPTPSTARPPPRRFPAGISLSPYDNDDDEEDTEEEAMETTDMQRESAHDGFAEAARVASLIPTPNSEELSAAEGASSQAIASSGAAAPESSPEDSTAIDDPLSATIVSDLAGAPPIAEAGTVGVDQEHDVVQTTTPLRTTMTSPPPLPLPLPVSVEAQEAEPAPQSTIHTTSSIQNQQDGSSEHRQSTNTQSENRDRNTGTDERLNGDSITIPDPNSIGFSVDEQGPSSHEHEQGEDERIPQDQYRTLVRYQPRLPKAHMMSDLISQIRVECPHKDFGCSETMEVQHALQHGREQCHYRLVMCPRSYCGLWMRADQILEHILMMEQPCNSGDVLDSSRRSSSSSSSVSSPSSTSSVRTAGHGLRQGSTAHGKKENRSLCSQRSNGSKAHRQQPKITRTIIPSGTNHSKPSSVPSCAGLAWEREQLARATGIIGQLTEENTSLRQMIRQLTLQNSKLMKDKDRWQRYANLDLRRD